MGDQPCDQLTLNLSLEVVSLDRDEYSPKGRSTDDPCLPLQGQTARQGDSFSGDALGCLGWEDGKEVDETQRII
jgi:hypothetical protein